MMLEFVFWLSAGLVVYSYALFPFVLIGFSALVQIKRDLCFVLKKHERRISDNRHSTSMPRVGIIISAYNEGACIAERVKNLQALDYPKDKIKYYIGSDGSKDNTAEVLQGIDDPNLVFVNFEQNRGKASVLNDLVAMAEEEYLVFSDANTEFNSDAVSQLLKHFGDDSKVDAVCGELDLYAEASGENLDSAYWQYERVLKFNESKISGLLGANGAIYAIRKNCFKAISPDTIVDDFTIVFQVAVDGGKVIYAPEAVAREEVAPSSADEYKRRVRIGAGNFQAFRRFLKVLSPSFGSLWFTYISHKVLRWHGPHLLLLAFISSLLLSFSSYLYAALFAVQCLLYLVSYQFRDKNLNNKLFKLLIFWVNMNVALGHGALRYYRGGVKGTWDSTNRE